MKRWLPAITGILLSLQCFPQFMPLSGGGDTTFTPPAYADVNSNYRTYANNIFGLLEANRVPTGLLLDYAFDFTEPKTFNGVTLHDSTLVEPGIFSELYKTIFTGKFNNTVSLRHPNVHDSLFYIARQKNVITLSGLLFKYNAIDPNAQANGKIDVVSGKLKDKYVSGVWQNPYQEFTTLAITPSTIRYTKKNCSVIFPQSLWLSNVGSTVSSIQFDAGDGAGYRSLAFNTSISLSYADTGWKHWTFKVNRTGSLPALYTHTKVHFGGSGAGVSARTAGVPISARGSTADVTQIITAAEAYNGVAGSARVIVSYRSASDPVIRRPLIVAEGFDPGHITVPEEEEGVNSFDDFITTVGFSGSANLGNLISADPSTYDIIYVNWNNGTDYLQRNAFVLEAVIRWVNAQKQPLSGIRQPNVVLGSSMGGVIARMALGRMDRGEGSYNGSGGYNAHETKLYISLDGPHLGANVPLGLQAAARYVNRMYMATGPLTVEYVLALHKKGSPLETLHLADQPASRQLLMKRIDFYYNQSNTDYQNFQTELRTQWAFPTGIRCVAISNGNECAIDQEYTPGSALLYFNLDVKTRFLGDLLDIAVGGGISGTLGAFSPFIPYNIPGSNRFHATLDVRFLANGGGNRVFYANITYTKKILWLVPVTHTIANKTYNAPSGLLPLDTYPGGFYTIDRGKGFSDITDNSLYLFSINFNIKRRFAFVHTTSALCIGGGNQTLTGTQYMARYIGATPPAAPYNTPFQNFTTAFNADGAKWVFEDATTRRLNNEPHEWFFLRSANWLAVELNRVDPAPGPASDCSAFCNSPSITGPNTLCSTSATYSVPAITGASYIWTALPAGSVSFSGSGNAVTATKSASFNGDATIRAIITTPICGSIVLNKMIATGKIEASSINVTYNSPSNPTQPLYPLPKFDLTTYYDACLSLRIIPTNVPSGATVTWSATAPGATWQQVGNYFVCFFTALNQTADVNMKITNDCGSSSAHYRFRCVNSGLCGGPTPSAMPLDEPLRAIVSPNPAQQTVTVTLNEEYNTIAKAGIPAKSGNNIAQVKIYNVHGVAVKSVQYAGITKQVQIDIAGLLPGLYFVEVSNGIDKQTSKLVISR